MVDEGRVYGGVPAEQRRRDRRRRLVDAGLELFGTRGVAGVTIGEVCAEAGLAKRYFYEEFTDLEALVGAVIDDIVETLQTQVDGDRREDDHEWPRRRIAIFVKAVSADPRIARVVLVETFGARGSLAALREALIHRAVELIASDFMPLDGSLEPADDRRLRIAAYALSGATAELILAWIQGDVRATAEEIVDYLVGLFAHTPSVVRSADARPVRPTHVV